MYMWPWSFANRKHFNLNEMLKEIPDGFPFLDTLSVFSFSKVEQHPKCLDQGIQTQKTTG